MLIIDVPDNPLKQIPVLVEARAAQTDAKESQRLYGAVGVCHVSPELKSPPSEKDQNASFSRFTISPRDAAYNIFFQKYPDYRYAWSNTEEPERSGKGPNFLSFYAGDAGDAGDAGVEILQPPKHGALSKDLSPHKDIFYFPSQGYSGIDKAVFLVNIQGYKIKVVYYIKVADINVDKTVENYLNRYCPAGNGVIIPNASDMGGITTASLGSTIANLTDGACSLSLPERFTGYDYASPAVTFTNLTGAAVGETKSLRADASITLNIDAAGHGWFIDYTPYLNEEFLPTANPNAWIASLGRVRIAYLPGSRLISHLWKW